WRVGGDREVRHRDRADDAGDDANSQSEVQRVPSIRRQTKAATRGSGCRGCGAQPTASPSRSPSFGLRIEGRILIAAAVLFIALFLEPRPRLVAPQPTLYLRDRRGVFLAEIADDDNAELGYWPVGELPPRVVAATLAVEDRRFWSHPGIDPLAVMRAAWQNLR